MASITRKQIQDHARKSLLIANNIVAVKSKVGSKAALELSLWTKVRDTATRTIQVLETPELDLQQLIDAFAALTAAEREAKEKLD